MKIGKKIARYPNLATVHLAIIAIISLVHVTTYVWFWSDGSQ